MTRSKPTTFWLTAALLLVFALPAVAEDTGSETATYNLRPTPTEGQTARYQFWTTRTQTTDITFGDRQQQSTNVIESEGEVTWTVDRVKANGDLVCTMTLDWMTADIGDGQSDPANNDSRKGSGDVPFVHDLIKAMAGKPLTVEVRADGSIASVEGVDAMRKAAENEDAVPDELDFEESASDLATLVFAPESAAIGDTWDASFRWSHELGHLEQDWDYRFTGIEEIAGVPVAVVTGTAIDMDLDPDKLREEMPRDSPDIRVDLKNAEGELKVLFDLTRNEAVGREGRIETVIEMTVPLPDGRKIERRIEETITGQTLRISED